MDNLEEFVEAVGRDVKKLNEKSSPQLTLTGITLGIVGGNSVTLPQPENVSHELRGTGMPNGVLDAPIGTTYIDTAKTNGALKWIKTTNDRNRGWKVVEGDTDWVLGFQDSTHAEAINQMYFRRINDVVYVKLAPMFQTSGARYSTNLILGGGTDEFEAVLSIKGFNPVDDIFQTIHRQANDMYSETASAENSEAAQGTGILSIEYEYYRQDRIKLYLKIVTSELGVKENHVNPFSYLTEDEWPTALPG